MASSKQRVFEDDSGQRDAAWVEATLTGDTEAFGQLATTYERRAVATAYRVLGNSHDAQEVVQEAFIRAFRSLERLQDPTRFGPWFMRIVKNLSLNARRGRRSSATVTLDETQGIDGASTTDGVPMTSSATPDKKLKDRETQAALEAALDTLPEKQRMSLVLFAIEGWAQKDIAELLECSLENVKWNVFQARKRLRERMGEMLEL